MQTNLLHRAFGSRRAPNVAGLEVLAMPPIDALDDLVHRCSDNPVDRTVATMVFVLGCCQLAEGSLTPRMPSLVLVNAHGEEKDPMVDFARSLVAANRYHPPQSSNTGPFAFRQPEHARNAMIDAIRYMNKDGSHPQSVERKTAVDYYYAAQRTGFGCGQSRPYAGAWHEEFGLLSDVTGRVILHLGTHEDGEAFRDDALTRPDMLINALGVVPGMQDQPKLFGITGAIGKNLWDAKLAHALVKLPMPMLVLPHSTRVPLKLPDERRLASITDFLRSAFHRPIAEPDNFPPEPWVAHYAVQLRKRLRHLLGDYENSLQRLARQLYLVCWHLSAFACQKPPSISRGKIDALAFELYAHTLRGITISTAGLAWHGLGFDAGCAPTEVARVLDYLRKKPPMTETELRRNAHIETKQTRDTLLRHFLEEDLVRIDGDKIRATTFIEFVTALHTRKEFPFPEMHGVAITKKHSAVATA